MRRFLVVALVVVLAMTARRMLFGAGAGPFSRPLAYATLTRYGLSPVLTRGGVGTWDHDTVAGEQVFLDTRLNRFVMVYSALAAPIGSGGTGQIGLAYSTDLLNWTKEAANPVFTPNGTEGHAATANVVQLSSSSYRMYYQSYGGSDGGARIYAASSSDLITWTRLNGGVAVIPPGSAGAWDSEFTFDQEVKQYGSTTYAYYGGQKDTLGVRTRGIGYATSSDGVTFTKYADNPILVPSGGERDANLGAMSIIGDQTDFDMFYDSSTTPGDRYIDHAHTSDGGATWDMLDYEFFMPSVASWDSTQVFDAATIVRFGVLYLFYAGSNVSGGSVGLSPDIGLATMAWP